mgnify:CR=1 FL=1
MKKYAWYFPNWHADAVNEKWHGKGWTEWEVVKVAHPRFEGHLQPKKPLWGYEDESDPKVFGKKIAYAKKYGVDGFIFDFYWLCDLGRYRINALEKGFLGARNADDLDPDGYYGIFEADRALFISAELKGATMLREWEGKFGLMPQPKYDELQTEYNSNLFGSCLAFCIPNTNKNLSRTGIIVDYLTYKSCQSLLPRYYDIHVSLKALGRQESIDVLSLIRGTRGIEVSVPFGWTTTLNSAMIKLAQNNEHSIASAVESARDAIIAAIDKTYAEYPALNKVNG